MPESVKPGRLHRAAEAPSTSLRSSYCPWPSRADLSYSAHADPPPPLRPAQPGRLVVRGPARPRRRAAGGASGSCARGDAGPRGRLPRRAALCCRRLLSSARAVWQRVLPAHRDPVPRHARGYAPVPAGHLPRGGRRVGSRLQPARIRALRVRLPPTRVQSWRREASGASTASTSRAAGSPCWPASQGPRRPSRRSKASIRPPRGRPARPGWGTST